jgi:hypothetical protein
MNTEPSPSEVVFFKLGDEDVVHGRWREPRPLDWSFWYHGRPLELRIEGMPGVGRFGNMVDISVRDQGIPYSAEQIAPGRWRVRYREGGWHAGNYSDGEYELEIDLTAMVVTWRCLNVSHSFYSDTSDR